MLKLLVILAIIIGLIITIKGVMGLPGLEGVNYTRNSTLIDDLTRAENGWMIVEPPEGVLPIRPALGEVRGVTVLYGRGYHVLEADPYMRMSMHPANSTLHFIVDANPFRPYPFPDVPVTLCVNHSTVLDRVARPVRSPYCPEHERAYEYPRLAFGEELLVNFNETPPTWWAWFGGDPVLGVTPQGLGDGLPVCDGITWWDTLPSPNNSTKPFLWNQSLKWQGNNPGCSVTQFQWRSNQTGSWAQIPLNNATAGAGKPFDCQGTACRQNNPSAGTWYRREPICDEYGQWHVRGWALYNIPSLGIYNAQKNFPIRSIDCGEAPSQPGPPAAQPELPAMPPTMRDKNLYYTLLPLAFGLIIIPAAYMARKQERNS